MFGQTWEHDIIRKYVILFGTLFNDIYINRHNADNLNEQTLKIPLNYGPKDKILARLQSDPDLNRSVSVTLPRMSFEMLTLNYAPDRKLNTMNQRRSSSADGTKTSYQYEPVPYDFTFALYILTKNVTDGTRIVEQILPYFRPQFNVRSDLIDCFGEDINIPVILNDVTPDDSYEGDFTTRRTIIWTLTFTMKGWLFGPTRSQGIINSADVNFRIAPSSDSFVTVNTSITPSVTVTATPGLDANGNPTSNSTLSIDTDLIKSTDNYGWIIEIDEDL